MALVGLIRVTALAKLLGVTRPTCERWMRAAGYSPVRAPVTGLGRAGEGPATSPLYIGVDAALALAGQLLPAKVDRLVLARLHRQVRRQAGSLRVSTAALTHDGVGGTGSGAPPSNTAAIASQRIFQ